MVDFFFQKTRCFGSFFSRSVLAPELGKSRFHGFQNGQSVESFGFVGVAGANPKNFSPTDCT